MVGSRRRGTGGRILFSLFSQHRTGDNMNVKKSKKEYITSLLYKSAIEDEKDWRSEKGNEHDVVICDRLIKEVRELGYNYHYLVDITNRENDDKELLDIVLKYIGKFNDEFVSAELVGVVGTRGYYAATETILNYYKTSSEMNKYKFAIFYDNALYRIKDKRFISSYLELLKKPEDAIKFPLTMALLGRWQVTEALPFFLQYLNSTLLYRNESTSDLLFIAINALSYYRDEDGSIRKEIELQLMSKDKAVVSAAQKAIKRLNKK